jgi:tRNA A-37 threonylcarbamoyl transferase component Bud32
LWLAAAVLVTWVLIALIGLGYAVDMVDHWLLLRIVSVRTSAATALARRLQALGSPDVVLASRWVVILGALAFRRFRHAAAFLACVLVTTWITSGIAVLFTRSRPLEVDILGSWTGFSHPSRPLADMAVVLIGVTYTLVPRGRWRGWAKAGTTAYLVVLAASRLYLAVEHPTDALFGIIPGVAVTLVIFRVFVPSDIFPVRYRRGKAAHLDVGGRRGEAILVALREQLAVEAVAVEPFGLDGSSGSTPLRITVAGATPTTLFGKLYAKNHLRADRSYKLFRTLLYGRLEDESTFSSVRRLIQYEDYLLRLMHGAGVPTARPYGFVEITPEREYLLVTEFFEGAREITDAEVDDGVIDDALSVVRRLWDEGLAHRDIKPANVMVRDGKVLLIDVAFAEVRPSPWRQAVDLANMMLVLALSSDPDHVYERAIRVFTPGEISEAFAATRGIALTSQLRARLRQDGRDLVSRCRELAPPCRQVPIQRWSLRRIGLTVGVLVAALLALQLAVGAFQGASLL